jgi:hypothetical protein
MRFLRTRNQDQGRVVTAASLDEGNDVGISPDDTCLNAGCEHPASAHSNAPLGDLTGACTAEGCTCSALSVAGDSLATADSGGDGAAGGEVPAGDAADGTQGGDAPELAGPATASAFSLAEFQEGLAPGEMEGPPFVMPVMVVEGVETGDGRMIAPGALAWLDPPMPLMGLKSSAHDPSGMSVNDPAVMIGRIDYVQRKESDPNVLQGGGVMLTTDDGMEWAQIIDQMGRVGVSVDVGDVESQIAITETGGDEGGLVEDADVLETLTKGSVLGATACAFPAFPQAYIMLGSVMPEDNPEMAPTPEGAQMAIRVAHAEPCEPCTSGVVAAAGPLRPPTAWFQDPGFHDGDPRLVPLVDQRTGRPNGRYSCPVTVTEDGQVYGHLAEWGVCHLDKRFGKCMLPPRSRSGYAVFHGGGSVLTAEGTLVDTGPLTVDGPHAPLGNIPRNEAEREAALYAAVRRYDDTTTRVANVCAGEDEYGIWVAGAIHPSATEEQVYTLRSSHLSGDWRPWGSGQELIAGHCVNTPGFPTAKATLRDGRVTSLIAAGVPCFAPGGMSLEDRVAFLEARERESLRSEMFGLEREGLRREMAALDG